MTSYYILQRFFMGRYAMKKVNKLIKIIRNMSDIMSSVIYNLVLFYVCFSRFDGELFILCKHMPIHF